LPGLEVLRERSPTRGSTRTAGRGRVWTNEEGSRFSPAMMGSGAYAGVFPAEEIGAEEAHRRRDLRRGAVEDRLSRGPVGGRPTAAYFEAHIEQGPILEAEGRTIGVVTRRARASAGTK
jgi:N-carbamoyl-L-amino-acid hydrolase